MTSEFVSVLMLHGDSNQTDIVQNAIDLGHVLGPQHPKVAILPAVETVSPKIQATLGPAILCQNRQTADRSQVASSMARLRSIMQFPRKSPEPKGLSLLLLAKRTYSSCPLSRRGTCWQSSLNTWQKRRWLAPF